MNGPLSNSLFSLYSGDIKKVVCPQLMKSKSLSILPKSICMYMSGKQFASQSQNYILATSKEPEKVLKKPSVSKIVLTFHCLKKLF